MPKAKRSGTPAKPKPKRKRTPAEPEQVRKRYAKKPQPVQHVPRGMCALCQQDNAPLRGFDQKFLHTECRALPSLRAIEERYALSEFKFSLKDLKLLSKRRMPSRLTPTSPYRYYYYLQDLLDLEQYLFSTQGRRPKQTSQAVTPCSNYVQCHNSTGVPRECDGRIYCDMCKLLPPFHVIRAQQAQIRYPQLNLTEAVEQKRLHDTKYVYRDIVHTLYYEQEIRDLLGLPPLLTSYYASSEPETEVIIADTTESASQSASQSASSQSSSASVVHRDGTVTKLPTRA